MKILYITGLSGIGKTTVTDQISKKYSIPILHLDRLIDKGLPINYTALEGEYKTLENYKDIPNLLIECGTLTIKQQQYFDSYYNAKSQTVLLDDEMLQNKSKDKHKDIIKVKSYEELETVVKRFLLVDYDTGFYFDSINSVGGIETFFYQIAKKFKDKDITIFYKKADKKQLERLRKYVNCVQCKGETITCNTMYYNLNIDIIDNVIADEHIQILHGDYKALNSMPNINKKITSRISVSEVVSNSFEELTGIKSKVIYNPYEREQPKKVLKLLTASRLTKEKGKERIIKLANELDKAKIPFIWYLYSDNQEKLHNNIITLPPRLDLIDYINDVDYLVQLSDTEGFCYSLIEALSVGTPVITTNMPIIKEIAVNEGNGFILDFDMSNLDVKEVYKRAGKFNFKYTPPISEWEKEIKAYKTNYKKVREMKYIVTANEKWEEMKIINTDMGRISKKGEKWEVDKLRLDVLKGNNPYKIDFIESYHEVKAELTITELKAIAREQNIKGYTKMNKKELEQAITR